MTNKAMKFFAQVKARRALPGNCHRCGRPNPDKQHSNCIICRTQAKAYKQRRKELQATKRGNSNRIITERLDALEQMLHAHGQYINQIRNYATGRYLAGYRAGKAKSDRDNILGMNAWETMFGGREDLRDCKLGYEEYAQMSHTITKRG